MGKFQPGQSGNAGGRPKSKKLREALSPFIDKAVARLGKLLDSKDPRVALQACRELFDRVYGKALTTAEVTIEDNRAADLGEMIPMTPAEVAISIAELLNTSEREMGLEPMVCTPGASPRGFSFPSGAGAGWWRFYQPDAKTT